MTAPWLIGCERSGAVRRAFRAIGIEAVSCDIVPADDGSEHHIVDDIQDVIKGDWTGAILFPDCTYLTVAGLHWNKRVDGREALTEKAITFVERLWAHRERIGQMAIENPIGCLSTRSCLGKPAQVIQPHQFGEDASKATCFWLHGLPKLVGTRDYPPRIVGGRKRWGNQTDSGQNRLAPSPDRAKLRAQTYAGIAAAMADQWGTT